MELTAKSATELAGLVQRGEVTPVEVTRAFLERIERLNPSLGAFQGVRAERALSEAGELAQRADLERLPLAGVPVAIKDNVHVAGEPTRFGSAATSADPAQADDELVQRLRRAGAVVIGITRMPELAIWPFTEPEAFGPARNPWDPARTPGGSTGGGASAVAARMAPLALGSDGGGSIRIPAACCGIVGIKPGPGVVPLAAGSKTHWYGLSEFGPLANTVADTALMLDVLAGGGRFRDVRPPEAKLRITVSTRFPTLGGRVSREVKDAVANTAARLREAGHQVEEDDPPYPASLPVAFSRRWLAGIAADAEAFVHDPGRLEARTRGLARAGRWVQRRGLDANASEDPLGARMTQWFSGRDVLVMPTLSAPAMPVDRWKGQGWLRTMLGVSRWIMTPQWNLARLPAMSVPAGLSADGLPLAVQLVGAPGSEALLLALAAQLESLQAWPRWNERPA